MKQMITNTSALTDDAFELSDIHLRAIAAGCGFTYWPGGETAPDDWDGGVVLIHWGGSEVRPFISEQHDLTWITAPVRAGDSRGNVFAYRKRGQVDVVLQLMSALVRPAEYDLDTMAFTLGLNEWDRAWPDDIKREKLLLGLDVPPALSGSVRARAERAFEELHKSAPMEAPGWNELHQAERDHLVRFAEILLQGRRA